MNETIVTVVGNVASDVVMKRVGPDSAQVVNFRIVSSERRFDRATETWGDGDRFSASVACWRRLADGALASLVKGDPVVLTGRLSVREYEQNGERRFMTEIRAIAVGPDLARSTAAVTRNSLSAVDGSGRDTAVGDEEGAEGADEAVTELVGRASSSWGDGDGERLSATA